jgi:hypothetical protein
VTPAVRNKLESGDCQARDIDSRILQIADAVTTLVMNFEACQALAIQAVLGRS